MVQDNKEVILQALAESTFAATVFYYNMHQIDEFGHHKYEDLQQVPLSSDSCDSGN